MVLRPREGNGKPSVCPETRQRILAVAEKVSRSKYTFEPRISLVHRSVRHLSSSERAEAWHGRDDSASEIHFSVRFLRQSIFNLRLSQSNACLLRVIEKQENRPSDKSLACEVKALISNELCEAAVQGCCAHECIPSKGCLLHCRLLLKTSLDSIGW